ncbi:MAG: FAD-dependent monooxygenase [Chitinophagales bacterium]|nr:FAD-dependent monooxygenase [Chitinophagales bacterium]
MVKRVQLRLLPAEAFDDAILLQKASKEAGINRSEIQGFIKVRQSIDARGRQIYYQLVLDLFIGEPATRTATEIHFRDVRKVNPVLIIGAGPAGLFAALKLIELGIKPIILERGKDVRSRRRDLADIMKSRTVHPESNYCFGEGGAGTYSDGKLYTRSNKRGDINRILDIFFAHGADERILYEAHPHIGTNKLPQIITAMRERIEAYGGEVHFNTRLEQLLINNGAIVGAKASNGAIFHGKALILATGHSARDIFKMLQEAGIDIQAKPFALGVRIEHPQGLIDSIQYHCPVRDEFLPPASYSLVQQVDGRGVFSFCMCPGGIIAPAATNVGEVVVNGWSPSKRNNPFANSGMVVGVAEEDFKPYIKYGPLAGMYYQQAVEQQAFIAGGSNLTAPAQRMTDFVKGRISATLPNCSYVPGIQSADLSQVLPPAVSKALKLGLQEFGKKMKGYFTEEGVLVGTESRTSTPVRIPRDAETLQHPQVMGLFPCGEGAGYAGGIVSAAMDGENCALAAARYINK